MGDDPQPRHAKARALGARPASARAAGFELWRVRAALLKRLEKDVSVEISSGRLVLWLPVLFATGILIYFAAEQEPSLVAGLLLAGLLSAGAMAARARPVTFAILTAFAALAWGFSVATLQTARIAHPVIMPPKGAVMFTGHVEAVERRAKADRILLRVTSAEGKGLETVPERVRLSLPKGTAPAVGTAISQLARLLPPLAPTEPGAYDFGRGPWFQGIGAVGFALGKPKLVQIDTPVPWSVRFQSWVAGVREGVGRRIRLALSEPAAGIAVALVTGDRSGVSPEVEESMRRSGLTHVLSISGLHMALVAGTLFALVRGLLALLPVLALNYPVKSIAAVAALAGSAFYLLLSGNDVPAQRSFIMTGLVLAGVLVGRPALSLRTVAVAAFIVLALAPQAVLEPGTQMSFAATLGLVAIYEQVQPARGWRPPDGFTGRLAFKLAIAVAALALTSLVAGLATAPFGAHHFQRLAPYGLLANLAAMPAVSFLVMPFGLIGVLLLPFGLDGLAWPVMGVGIDIMTAVSDKVAALPGALMRVDGIGVASAAFAGLALCCLCLLRGLLAVSAVIPAVLAVALAGAPQRPDVLIAPDARTVAVRGGDGRLSVAGAGSNRMAVSQWLSRDADTREPNDPSLKSGFSCDRLGCVAPLPGGGTLALSLKPEGLEADCLEARLLVTSADPPEKCPAKVYSPRTLSRTGAMALYRDHAGWRETPARDGKVQRPWLPVVAPEPLPIAGTSDPEADALQ